MVDTLKEPASRGLIVVSSAPPLTLEGALIEGNFLEVTGTAFVLRDGQGRVVDCNDRAERVFQTTREDLLSDDPLRVTWNPVHEDGKPFELDELPSVWSLRTGDPLYGVVQGIELPSGEQRWFSVNSYPVLRGGVVEGVLLAYLDATERVRRGRLVSLLLDVNRLNGELLGAQDAVRHLCASLVATGQFALAWVGVARPGPDAAIDIIESAGVTDYLFMNMVSWSSSQPSGLGPAGIAVRTNGTVVSNDLSNVPMMMPWRDRLAHFGLRSSICIPFRPGGERSVLVVYDRHRNTFDELTVSGLQNVVGEAERVIAHGNSARELAVALGGTLTALARVTEARDPYTAGHQSRVGSLAAAIAVRLGMEAALVERIREAGAVHDVGKVALASEILTKPGRLTDLEFRMMQRHPAIGHEILVRARLPWPIPDVAHQHHERLNGSGYPNGLIGNDIIMPARIVAVADVVEAMTNHRPYRPAVGLERALDEVATHAGELYDADVVRCCLDVFANGFVFSGEEEASLFIV